AGCYFQNCPRG
nr:vasopressin,N-Ala-Gly Arg [Bos taurus]